MSDSLDNAGGVHELASLVDYQAGSVVSRQLLKKKSGNITLFAFSAGEGLSEHTAPFDAWIYIPEGAAKVKVGDTMHALVAGESLIMPANVPHAVRAEVDFKMLLVMIRD